jgi:hypothetical protein
MKRVSLRGAARYLDGYTIIEVLIFLAVSGALLVAAATVISGRQERIRFTQGVVSFDQQLQDTFNDVSTGFYPSRENFSCTSSGKIVNITAGIQDKQGTNDGCIFVGKLLHFFISGSKNTEYKVYTLVGPRSATSIMDGIHGQFRILGTPQLLPDKLLFDDKFIDANIQLQQYTGASNFGIVDMDHPPRNYHSLVIVSDFGTKSGVDNSVTGNAGRVKLYGYRDSINNSYFGDNPSEIYPIDGSVALCLRQDGNPKERGAALIITKQLTIERQIDTQPAQCKKAPY